MRYDVRIKQNGGKRMKIYMNLQHLSGINRYIDRKVNMFQKEKESQNDKKK